MVASELKIYSVAALLIIGVLGGPKPAKAITINFFEGSTTTNTGRQNIAFENWDNNVGRPNRFINFDEASAGTGMLLSAYNGGSTTGIVNTSLGNFYAFKTGGDIGLFPLFSDPDNIIIAETNTSFKGITNLNDLTQANVNLLKVPGDPIFPPPVNDFVEVNFGEGVDIGAGTISNFGATEALGAFVSTCGTVTLDIWDISGTQIGTSQTQNPGGILPNPTLGNPCNLTPFYFGVILSGVDNPEIIAKARYTFSEEGGFDGLVFASAVGIATPVPEPATFLLLGAGLGGMSLLGWKKKKGV